MNIKKYLNRISYSGNPEPTIECLSALHHCHVMSIPFEALDVQFKNPIKLDLDHIYDKVVVRGRGGYCYELNSLFHSLLKTIGFNCWMVSSQIINDGQLGPEFDHMSIVVSLDEDWLVDVGYGDLFLKPIKINEAGVQRDKFKSYKIMQLKAGKYLLTESLKRENDFVKKYQFDLTPRSLVEFEKQNTWKQENDDSYFVKNTICTIPTEQGRKTIFNNLFKKRIGNDVVSMEIENRTELLKILKREFNIEMEVLED